MICTRKKPVSVLELFVKLDVKHNVVGSDNGLTVCYLRQRIWYFQVVNVEIYFILTITTSPMGLEGSGIKA